MADDAQIVIGGDISPLEAALASMPAAAAQAGAAVNAALGQTSGPDALTQSVQAAGSAIQSIPPIADAAAASVDRMGASLKDFSMDLLKGGAGISLLTAPLALLGEEAIKTAAYFEQTQVAFATLLGSGAKASQMISDLTQMAIETPFEIKGLVDNTRKLLGMGYAAQEIQPMIRTLGDAVAALGAGDAGLKRLTLAFGEMHTRGTVAMKEMNQMAMMGIPAMEILASKLDMTHRELMDAIKKRTIDAATAIPLILEGMNERYGGSMKKLSETFTGMASNVADAITKTLSKIGDQMLPTVKSITSAIGPLLAMAEDAAKAFGRWPEPLKMAVLGVGALAVATGPLLFGLGAVGLAITGVQALLGTMGIALGGSAIAAQALAVAEGEAAIATTTLAAAQAAQAAVTAESTIAMYSAMVAANSVQGQLKSLASMPIPAILGTAAYVALAYEIGNLVVAYGKLVAAEQDLERVTKNDEHALATLKETMRQQGIDISEVSRQYYGGEISLTKYKQQLLELEKAFRAVHPAVRNALEVEDELERSIRKGSAALVDHQEKLDQAVKVAKGVYDDLNARLGEQGVTQQVVNAAWKDYQKALTDASHAIKGATLSLAELGDKTRLAAGEFKTALVVYNQALAAYQAGKIGADLFAAAQKQLGDEARKAGGAIQDAQVTINAAYAKAAQSQQALQGAIESYRTIKDLGDKTPTGQLALAEAFKAVETAAAAVGLTLKKVGDGFEFEVREKGKNAELGLKSVAAEMNKIAQAGLDLIMVNGKLVPTLESVGATGDEAAMKLHGITAAAADLPAAVTDVSGAVAGFQGVVTEMTTQAEQDIAEMQRQWQELGGDIDADTSAVDSMTGSVDALVGAFDAVAAAAYAASSEVNTLAAAEDAAAAAGERMGSAGSKRGGRGGGGGSYDAATMLSIYATAGASNNVLDHLAESMGLVKMGERQYYTPEQVAQFGAQGSTISSGPVRGSGGGSAPADPVTRAATGSIGDLGSAASATAKATMDAQQVLDTLADHGIGISNALFKAEDSATSFASSVATAANALDQSAAAASKVVTDQAAAVGHTVAALMDPINKATPAVSAPMGGLSNFGAMGTGDMAVHMTVQAGTIVGQNGMQQLADIITNRLTTSLRQTAGLKLA